MKMTLIEASEEAKEVKIGNHFDQPYAEVWLVPVWIDQNFRHSQKVSPI